MNEKAFSNQALSIMITATEQYIEATNVRDSIIAKCHWEIGMVVCDAPEHQRSAITLSPYPHCGGIGRHPGASGRQPMGSVRERRRATLFKPGSGVTNPPLSNSKSAPRVPPQGAIAVFGTLSTPADGTLCLDFETVDTGVRR